MTKRSEIAGTSAREHMLTRLREVKEAPLMQRADAAARFAEAVAVAVCEIEARVNAMELKQ